MASTDLEVGLDAMHDAADDYQKAVAYSDGPVTEVFVSRRVQRLLRDKGINFQTLLGDVVIDAVSNKLKIQAITSDTDSRTALIAGVDEDQAMALVRPAVMRRALQLGDSYLTAWPVLDDAGDPIPGRVNIEVHDPQTMRVVYHPETREPSFAIQRWATKTNDGRRIRIDLIYADRIEHYIAKGARSGKAADFMPFSMDGGDAIEDNPYGFPVFHFHGTGLPGEYGCAEHKSFYGTQDKLIKLTTSHMASVDYHALPQRVALREAGSIGINTPAELDEWDFVTSPDGRRTSTPSGEEQLSSLSSAPGSVWDLEGYKDVKQLDPGNPDVFLKPRQDYLREGSVASNTPLHLFDRTGQIPSGEALKTANEPLDSKASARKTSFDSTWRRVYRFVLSLLGEENAPVSLAWTPIESTDESTRLSQAAKKLEVGVPADQTLTELGYKADDVERWITDGEGGLPQRIALLGELANAVAGFSTAVAAGVIDQATVQAVISKAIGDLDGGPA